MVFVGNNGVRSSVLICYSFDIIMWFSVCFKWSVCFWIGIGLVYVSLGGVVFKLVLVILLLLIWSCVVLGYFMLFDGDVLIDIVGGFSLFVVGIVWEGGVVFVGGF